MYLPSLLQRASQRTLNREDHVAGAGFCQLDRTFGIAEASNEATAPSVRTVG
ncbi:hypothetical protein [Nibricoccus aquaticus]|uniref:hypothetical protein n=1 Tax=Nibricoccus aquaticus TaxID=2576891 RepID=UPI0015866D92|nr:hypothetical protein [Nibricoccus aquaticus]